jgi:hypothetical protein
MEDLGMPERYMMTKSSLGSVVHNDPVCQPLGECDPESPIPCSCPRRCFTDPPDFIPMPATESNVPALEVWIKDYFKASAFNQCRRQP